MCLQGSDMTSLGSPGQGNKGDGPEQNDDETIKVGQFLCKTEVGCFEVKTQFSRCLRGCSKDGF